MINYDTLILVTSLFGGIIAVGVLFWIVIGPLLYLTNWASNELMKKVVAFSETYSSPSTTKNTENEKVQHGS